MTGQNYKIHVNGIPVFLTSPDGAEALGFSPGKDSYVGPYWGKRKQIRQFLDLLDKNRSVKAVVLHSADLEGLWQDFKACFKWLEAAGGYVLNPEDRLLVFFRRGSWDLPKGKIDPGETPEQAAVREVQEETGLHQLDLGQLLLHTYHTYTQRGEHILKKTWWYAMRTTDRKLIPQTEEDIEQIEWVEPRAWLESGVQVYESIREVIRAGLTK